MKFRMNFGVIKTVIVAVIIVGALAIAALDIAMLAGANGVATQQPAVAWVSIVAAVIIAVAALLVLFNSYYGFKEDKMVSVLGFFVDKIKYEDIVCIKQNSLTGEIYLITKGLKEQDGEVSFKINVAPQKTDAFIHEMRNRIGEIIVEVFTPEKKNKDKEMSPVTSAMNKVLNEDERQIVTLHAISGFKHREIADMLDKPLGTVVWSYNNALSKLKKELQKEDEE